MWWIVGVVALVVIIATYVTWIAKRVDRLHQRAAAATAALDSALARRAAAAGLVADALDRPDLRELVRAATDPGAEDRQGAENALTKALRDLPEPLEAPVMTDVVAISRKVSLTRHIHTDLVRDALGMRRRRLVRVMRFARKYTEPVYFDIEDPILTHSQ